MQPEYPYGIICHMVSAALLYHDKGVFADGAIVELKIWRLPQQSAQRPHGLKYSLFYGVGGRRLIGYDNESGKGDHRHEMDLETPYRFVSVERLIADFLADVRRVRGEE